jgi:hypothetical protein
MIQAFLAAAIVIFVLWLVLTLIGAVFRGLIHLLWIVILVLFAVWVWRAIAA